MSLHETLLVATKPQSNEALSIIKRNNDLINKMNEWSTDKPKIKNETEYQEALLVKRLLCSLSCDCFNTMDERGNAINAREDVYGNALEKFNRHLIIKDKEQRLTVKYLVWGYYLPSINYDQVILKAIKEGNIRKEITHNGGLALYVVGLKFKVGDNVFKKDRNNREHRLYVNTIGRQAIPINWNNTNSSDFYNKYADIINSVPDLDKDTFYVTYTGNRKGSVAPIKFGSAAINSISRIMRK